MPATSEKQRKLFGAALAAKRGASPISQKIAKIARATPEKELSKMASKDEVAQYDNQIGDIYAVAMPYDGCQASDMVHKVDPMVGIQNLEPQQVHGFYPEEEIAMGIAEGLYEDHMKAAEMLEKKKDDVLGKIKETIDALEAKRTESVNMIKENPKDSAKHKDTIAHLATKIDDLMTKLEKIESSKKEIKKDDKKKDLKEAEQKSHWKVGEEIRGTKKIYFLYNDDSGKKEGSYKTKDEAKKALDKKQNLKEAFEVHFSDGIRQSKKFKDPKAALSFAKELISTNKNLQNVDVFNAGANFNSTADTDSVIAWWGDGSFMDNKSKKDPKLAAKKIK